MPGILAWHFFLALILAAAGAAARMSAAIKRSAISVASLVLLEALGCSLLILRSIDKVFLNV